MLTATAGFRHDSIPTARSVVAGVDHELPAVGGEAAGEGQSEAPGRSGDEGGA